MAATTKKTTTVKKTTKKQMVNNNTIYFYREYDPYGEFSNFAKYPITIDGVVWPTSEHYFQAMKF